MKDWIASDTDAKGSHMISMLIRRSTKRRKSVCFRSIVNSTQQHNQHNKDSLDLSETAGVKMRITRDLAPRHQTCTEDLQTEAIFRGTPEEKNVIKPLKITGPSGLIERTEN